MLSRMRSGNLMTREAMPGRRRSWTQHVGIAGQSVYMTVGEYADGRPGEVFVDVARQGTFLRGVMGALARTISIALQCGSGVDVVVHALRGLDYPPAGPVSGSAAVGECSSVTDWMASELAAHYMGAQLGERSTEPVATTAGAGDGAAPVGRVAGHMPEPWRSGV